MNNFPKYGFNEEVPFWKAVKDSGLQADIPFNLKSKAIKERLCQICGGSLIYNYDPKFGEIVCSNCKYIYYEE